jgi:hypothetical protein
MKDTGAGVIEQLAPGRNGEPRLLVALTRLVSDEEHRALEQDGGRHMGTNGPGAGGYVGAPESWKIARDVESLFVLSAADQEEARDKGARALDLDVEAAERIRVYPWGGETG